MTETRRAVPKGAALFISLFLPVSRLSSCSTHLISSRSRPQRLRRTFLRVRACPSFTFPWDPRHGRRLQPEHLSRRPRFLALIAAAPPNVIITARNSRDS